MPVGFAVLKRVWIVTVLSACTLGPDYEPPAPAMPAAWSEPLGEGLIAGEFAGAAWWDQLGDPLLTRMIVRAVRGNPTLGAAIVRIRQSRAILQQVSGQYVPDVDGTGGFSRSRDSASVSPFPVKNTSVFSLGLDMFWEIDLFGRIRRSVEAADAQVDGSIEDYRDVLTILQAEVGLAYVQLRTIQRQLVFLNENIALQRSSRDLAKARFETRVSPELDVFQAESNLASSEAQLPGLELSLSRVMHRLAVLLGEQPGAFRAELREPKELPKLPSTVAVGIPAELLLRRPDVRRAERQLASQTARIGAAEAQLYPSLSLAGALGLSSFDFDTLFKSRSRSFSLVPGFSWNLFDGGRVHGVVDEEVARTEQARLAYENTLLLALEEAENSIASWRRERQRRAALARVVAAAKKQTELATTLYKEGLRNFQNVLDAERTLSGAQDALAASEGAVVAALITLYRALGGGWEVETDAADRGETSRDK